MATVNARRVMFSSLSRLTGYAQLCTLPHPHPLLPPLLLLLLLLEPSPPSPRAVDVFALRHRRSEFLSV
jgi:hypothetical protein